MRKRSVLIGVLAVVSAASLPAVASADDMDAMIVGGHDATEEYSFMASLQQGGSHGCGASLIKPEWAVTAAHCVQGGNPADFTLRIGSKEHASGGEEVGVADVIAHDSGDIALIKLDRAAQSTPIKIAAESGDPGTETRIIGWGQTTPAPGGDAPATLQELDTSIVDDGKCTGGIEGATEICTDNPGGTSGACYGDSGGPQIKGTAGNWELIGATSRSGNGDSNCATGPSIYTDVVAFTDWINQNTGG